MILSSHVSEEKIFLFFSRLGNSIPNLVRLSGRRRAKIFYILKKKARLRAESGEATLFEKSWIVS
jgi:hypothetical protein